MFGINVKVIMIVACVAFGGIYAQQADTIVAPGGDTLVIPPDTALQDTFAVSDTVEADTTGPVPEAALTDTSFSVSDTALVDSSKLILKEGVQRLKIARRDYEYRKQLGYALGMMAFVALILTSTQSWNPD